MTRDHYGKIWKFVGAILLYYALNTWIVTQGGNEVFGAKLVSADRAPASVIGIFICSILLVLVCLLGRSYARAAGEAWHDRIPVLALDGLDTGSREGKWYQRAVLFCFTILPAAAILHFWDLVRDAEVVSTNTNEPVSRWDWSYTFQHWSDAARICSIYDKSDKNPCKDSGTFLPGLEMWLLIIVTAIAAIALMAYFWAIASPIRNTGLRREKSASSRT